MDFKELDLGLHEGPMNALVHALHERGKCLSTIRKKEREEVYYKKGNLHKFAWIKLMLGKWLSTVRESEGSG